MILLIISILLSTEVFNPQLLPTNLSLFPIPSYLFSWWPIYIHWFLGPSVGSIVDRSSLLFLTYRAMLKCSRYPFRHHGLWHMIVLPYLILFVLLWGNPIYTAYSMAFVISLFASSWDFLSFIFNSAYPRPFSHRVFFFIGLNLHYSAMISSPCVLSLSSCHTPLLLSSMISFLWLSFSCFLSPYQHSSVYSIFDGIAFQFQWL